MSSTLDLSLFGSDDEDEMDTAKVTDVCTSTTDKSDLLHKRPDPCGVLQFHNGTEVALLLHVQRSISHCLLINDDDTSTQTKINIAQQVLLAIDIFCYERHWMMHIGDQKSSFLVSAIQQAENTSPSRPILVVEIGSYCGYSAVTIASHFSHPLSRLICIENDANCRDWTQQMLSSATISSSCVHIIPNIDSLQEMLSDTTCSVLSPASFDTIDLLFLDHDKKLYLSDLKVILQSQLLKTGSIVVADNVLSFGTPLDDYLHFVQNENGSFASSKTYRSTVEYSTSNSNVAVGDYLEDGVEISVVK